MKREELEQLLYEEESPTLDFKRDQYAFAKAGEEEKSELLKDILGFVNCWRRSEALILIGVKEVQGGCSIVYGVSEHLQDHSLQQFVNNLTNRPVQFRYEACEFEGKQVGIIRIDLQRRPVYLKRDYGKLEAGLVYVRRGSCTDPTKPADPDEIAMMGTGFAAEEQHASLRAEFADPDREQSLGGQIEWSAEFCQMPAPDDIPVFHNTPPPIRLPGGREFHVTSVSSYDPYSRLNTEFYDELAEYEFIRRLIRTIRLVVANPGEVRAADVRVEISVPAGQGVGIIDNCHVPDAPTRRKGLVVDTVMKKLRPRSAFRHAGCVDIDANDDQTKVEIDCGDLQPGRKVWTDSFCMWICRSGQVKLTGYLFAANLPQPQEFTLSINAAVTETGMTVDELVMLGEPTDEEE